MAFLLHRRGRGVFSAIREKMRAAAGRRAAYRLRRGRRPALMCTRVHAHAGGHASKRRQRHGLNRRIAKNSAGTMLFLHRGVQATSRGVAAAAAACMQRLHVNGTHQSVGACSYTENKRRRALHAPLANQRAEPPSTRIVCDLRKI